LSEKVLSVHHVKPWCKLESEVKKTGFPEHLQPMVGTAVSKALVLGLVAAIDWKVIAGGGGVHEESPGS